MKEQAQIPPKRGVVLLNFGGPRNLDEVEEFLFEILRDPNTIQLPFPLRIQDWLTRKIAKKRSINVREEYDRMGGKSPIVEATESQRVLMEKALQEKGLDLHTYTAHRYLPGNAKEVAEQIVADKIEDLFLIPMYPHFSWATTGSSFEQFVAVLNQAGYSGRMKAVRSYPNHPLYVDTLADLLEKGFAKFQLSPENTLIQCSAHGLPRKYVDNGDPYWVELQATMEELRKRFPKWNFHLTFQSRVGPAEWLKPYTDDFITELEGKGVENLLFVAISFVNDHLETLVEVDHTYFELARSCGLKPCRIDPIETHPKFIELLAETTYYWTQEAQGLEVRFPLLPPSQQYARYDRWIWYFWCLSFIASLMFAIA